MSNSAEPEVSSHSNVVTFNDNSNTITGITYVPNSLVISDGQPSTVPPSIEKNGNTFKITLDAGRHKTTPVADKFNELSGGKQNEYAPEGDSGVPAQLNFFFEIQIAFSSGGLSTFAYVYVGQGSFGSTNNWWIGGKAISKVDTPQLVYTLGNKLFTLPLSGDQDTFNLAQANVRPVSPIKNVFVLMLENHSFDNMFAMSGIPGIIAATTENSNYFQEPFYVQDGAPTSMPTDPGHEFTDVVTQLCGMGSSYTSGTVYPQINNYGFAGNYATTTSEGPAPPLSEVGDIMACFDTPNQLPIIYQLAKQFAICDQWFSSLPGPTWPNRFFVHGASSSGLDHSPTKTEMFEWESVSGFTYPHGSIYDALNAAKIPFGLFIDTEGPALGSVPQVSALQNIFMTDVKSLNDFVSDLQGGNYPYEYTFIEPNYGDVSSTYEGGSSQHPMDGVARGEQLIQTVYEAIRNSNIWEQSLLIITYDEHGGFYDHFAPPGGEQQDVYAPNDGSSNKYNEYGFTFEQLGVRVPAVIVSPWIQTQVDHTRYDHSSVLATVEILFGLNALTQRDGTANNLAGLISSTLRTDCPTTLGRPASEPARPAVTATQRAILDQQPLPDQGNLIGFLAIAAKAEQEMSAGMPADRAAVLANVQAIQTRGEARAYIESVVARANAARARGRTRR